MAESRFCRCADGVSSVGLHLVWCSQEFGFLRRSKVLWSKSGFAASVGYVSESTVRRYIEQQWDAVG